MLAAVLLSHSALVTVNQFIDALPYRLACAWGPVWRLFTDCSCKPQIGFNDRWEGDLFDGRFYLIAIGPFIDAQMDGEPIANYRIGAIGVRNRCGALRLIATGEDLVAIDYCGIPIVGFAAI